MGVADQANQRAGHLLRDHSALPFASPPRARCFLMGGSLDALDLHDVQAEHVDVGLVGLRGGYERRARGA